MRRASLFLGAVVLVVVAACAGSPTATSTPPTTTAPIIERCVEGTVDGCRMVGLHLEPPSKLGAVEALTATWPGTLVGVWRTDWTCLTAPGAAMTPAQPPSRFAYLNADTIADRVAALNAPPITDGGSTFAVWDQRIESLQRLREDDPDLIGAAVWLPDDFVPEGEGISRWEVIPHRYAYTPDGILYVGASGFEVDPWHPEGLPFDESPPDCDGS